MTSGTDPTWGAISTYAKWAAQNHERISPEPLIDLYETKGWKAEPDGTLRWRPIRHTSYPFLFETLEAANPELHKQTRDAILADERFGRLEGGQVTTRMGSFGFLADQIIHFCIGAQIVDGQFLHDDALVQAAYDAIVQTLASSHLTATLIIPMPGLRVLGGSFELDAGIVFGRLSDDEFLKLAKLDLVTPQWRGFPMIDQYSRSGCRVEIDVPVSFLTAVEAQATPAPSTPEKRRFGQRTTSAFNDLIQDLLFATRLASPERIFATGAVLEISGWLGYRSSEVLRFPTAAFGSSSDYVIDDATANRLSTLWSDLKLNVTKHHLPDIAMRRFNAAVDRANIEDALVDLMIVTEALFLSDAITERSELKYRSRQRAAKLLATGGSPWRESYNVFGKAYDLRSTIVHGGDVPETLNLDGHKINISEFLSRLIELIREALAISTHEYATNKDFATTKYWDQLVMGAD
jgi:hypothetical protein